MTFEHPKPGTRIHIEFDGTVTEFKSPDPTLVRVEADEGCYHDVCLYEDRVFKLLPPKPQAGEAWFCKVSTRSNNEEVLLRLGGSHSGHLAAYDWVDSSGLGLSDRVVTPLNRLAPEGE